MTVYNASAVTQFKDTNASLVSSSVSTAAVASGTTLQTVTVGSAGNYEVRAWSAPGGSGTIAGTDAGNVLLKKGSTQVAVVPQVSSASVAPLPLVLNLALNAGDTLTLVTGTSNAPASVYYASTLIAQQVS